MEKRRMSLPIELVKSENKKFSFDDSLIPVDILVMHDGLNLNGSTFFENAIENAKESIKNKPILAYIKKEDGSDAKDFGGHEMEFVFGEDGLKIVYLERPIGVIGETNNYSVLEKDDKKFVRVSGFIWKEYLNDGYDIFKDNPTKSVSMEIEIDDLEFNDDGTVNILAYRYLGVTVLGDNVDPAMTGAEINVLGQFTSQDDFAVRVKELNQKLSQFSSVEQNTKKEEDGEKMKKDKELKLDNEEFEETSEEKFEEADEKQDSQEPNEEFEENSEKDPEPTELELLEAKFHNLQKDYESLEETHNALKEKYSELEKANETLSEYKQEKEAEIRKDGEDDIFSIYDEQLSGIAKYDELKDNSKEYSLEDLAKECAFLLVQNNKTLFTSKEDKKDVVKINKTIKKTKKSGNDPYNGIFED